jgi:hypothetical protein
MITTHLLELVLGFERLVSVKLGLELNMQVSGGVIDKHTSTRIHRVLAGLAPRRKEAALGVTHKMINRNSLPRDAQGTDHRL